MTRTIFEIQGRKIGPGHRPLVIPEVGINHEGQLSKAIALVDRAIECQAECIKFQCHITEKEMVPTNMKPGKISKERLWDIIKRCELTHEEEIKVKQYCDKKGIIYLSTPFSREAADRLDDMGVAAFKIGSGECNNYPLIEHIARKRKPIILSTGMNSISSIQKSVRLINKYKTPLILMHCVSMYPTPYSKVRLPAMVQLREKFQLPVGLSDHSLGIYTCLAAVALGAVALEKHFTIDRRWPGPDNPISIEPVELKELIKGSRAIAEAMIGHKEIQPEERPVIDFAYASVVTISPIRKNEIFTTDNLWVKRPGTGDFLADDFCQILGKKASRHLTAECQLKKADVIR